MKTPRPVALPLAALALVLLLADVAAAQAPPGGFNMPSKEEIEKRVKEEMDKLPSETTEIDGVKIEYKAVPTDPLEIVKRSGQLPPGMNPDQAAKQFLPLARPYVEKNMAEIGTLTCTRDVTLKSLKLKAGTYTFGLGVDMTELVPITVIFSGGDLKKPVALPLKRGAAKTPHDTLKVELAGVKKKDDEFTIGVGFAKVDALAGNFKMAKEK